MSRQGALFLEKIHITAHLDLHVGLIVSPVWSDVFIFFLETAEPVSTYFAQLILRLRIVHTGYSDKSKINPYDVLFRGREIHYMLP